MNLPIIPQDKANHFVYGSAIAIFAGAAAKELGLPVVPCSIAAATFFAAAKEALDWYKNYKTRLVGATPTHGVEFADFLATVAGGLSANFLLMLYKGILQ